MVRAIRAWLASGSRNLDSEASRAGDWSAPYGREREDCRGKTDADSNSDSLTPNPKQRRSCARAQNAERQNQILTGTNAHGKTRMKNPSARLASTIESDGTAKEKRILGR
jgi:hypothetical protein